MDSWPGSSVFLLQNEDKDNTQQLMDKINWKVKVRRCCKSFISPDVLQSPVRAIKWRRFNSVRSCCPHKLTQQESRNLSEAATTLKEVKASVAQMGQTAWFITRRSFLGEEQGLKVSVETSPGIQQKACGKLQGHLEESLVFVLMRQKCLSIRLHDVWRQQMLHITHKHTISRWSIVEAPSGSGEENITKSWRIIRHSQQEDYHLRRKLIFQLENHHMCPPEAPQKCLEATT